MRTIARTSGAPRCHVPTGDAVAAWQEMLVTLARENNADWADEVRTRCESRPDVAETHRYLWRVPARCGQRHPMRSAGSVVVPACDRPQSRGPGRPRHVLPGTACPLALPLPPPLPPQPLASAAELRQFTIYDLRPRRRRSTRSRSTATSMRRSGCTGACSTSVRSFGQACRQVQSNGELQRPMQT